TDLDSPRSNQKKEEPTMMNRRQFVVGSGAAGAALLARMPKAFAAPSDLIIEASITADARETIDARGKIVAPGLIDIHTHAGKSKEGPPMCLQDGVTGWVDAGSGGADNIDQVAAVARGAPQLGRVLVNIARTGVVTPAGELHDINSANVALARGAIERNRDVVVGVKARLSNNVAGANDLEALRRAQEAAAPFNLPVMIHIGQNYSPLRAILALLKRGDIVTHMYAPGMNGILDDKGILLPGVLAARRRGVIFDFGNGVADHFDWDTVEKATKQGLWPDTFSTDWNTTSKTTGVVDLPNVMSKFIMFGLPLSQIIACATVNAARVFPSFDDRGTLNVGAPADVAIMELREGNFEFLDNYKGVRTGRQRLFPVRTVLAGTSVQPV